MLDYSRSALIDWYNVQFYSQGTAYTTCETLITESGGDFPGTSLMEIVNSGIPQEKVVLGKPGTAVDAGSPSPSGGGGGGGTQVAGGGTEEAGGGTEEAGGGTEEASGGTDMASGGTEEAGGGNGARRRANLDPHGNGFLETETLAQCVMEAKKQGWNAGIMAWEFPNANKEWIQSARKLAWPVKTVKN